MCWCFVRSIGSYCSPVSTRPEFQVSERLAHGCPISPRPGGSRRGEARPRRPVSPGSEFASLGETRVLSSGLAETRIRASARLVNWTATKRGAFSARDEAPETCGSIDDDTLCANPHPTGQANDGGGGCQQKAVGSAGDSLDASPKLGSGRPLGRRRRRRRVSRGPSFPGRSRRRWRRRRRRAVRRESPRRRCPA